MTRRIVSHGVDRTIHGGMNDRKEIDPNNRGSIVIGSVAFYLDRYGYEVLPIAMRMLRGEAVRPRATTPAHPRHRGERVRRVSAVRHELTRETPAQRDGRRDGEQSLWALAGGGGGHRERDVPVRADADHRVERERRDAVASRQRVADRDDLGEPGAAGDQDGHWTRARRRWRRRRPTAPCGLDRGPEAEVLDDVRRRARRRPDARPRAGRPSSTAKIAAATGANLSMP